MRSRLKIILLPALLLPACASAGLWHVQGQRERRLNQSVEAAARTASVRHFKDVTIEVEEGSVTLKNVMLTRMMSSVILKGNLVNKTGRYLDDVTFEIKAYDRVGKLLKGIEEKNIFAVHQLKANASIPVNSGYGVWLQGIPLDDIARLEIAETDEGSAALSPSDILPFAGHALAWKEYAEIEE